MPEGLTKCQPRLLTPYLDGELEDSIRRQIQDHLQGCPSCGAMLDEVTEASQQVRGMGRAAIPTSALEPALEMFTEQAGLGPETHPLADTVLVARDHGAVAAEDSVADASLLPELAVEEAIIPEAATPPPVEDMTPEPVEDRAAAAGAALDTEATAELPSEAEMPAEAMTVEPSPAETAHAEEVLAEAGDIAHLRAEAPPEELTPPWVDPADETKADVSDLLSPAADEPDSATSQPKVNEPVADHAASVPEADATETGATEAGATEAEPQPPAGPHAILERHVPLDDRLEPPPEPWSTAWRPEPAETSDDAPVPGPEPKAEGPVAGETLEEHEPPPEPAPDSELPQLAMESSATGWIHTGEAMPEAEEALARLQGETIEPMAAPPPALDDDSDTSSIDEYRQALIRESHVETPGLSIPLVGSRIAPDRLKLAAVGVLVAALAVGGGAALAIATAGHNSTATTHKPAVQTSTAPRTQVSAAPSVVPSAAAPAVQLTGIVTAGSGGSGYRATRIRTGTPAAGVFRIVLDLDGSGPAPSVQLGKGPDGSLYLTASGIAIDPSVIQGFTPGGPVTGITLVDQNGLNLKLAMNSAPQYGIGYLTAPSRLVVDFK